MTPEGVSRGESSLRRAERGDKERAVKTKIFDEWLAEGSPGTFTGYCRELEGKEPVEMEWPDESETEPEPEPDPYPAAQTVAQRARKEKKATASQMDRELGRRDLH